MKQLRFQVADPRLFLSLRSFKRKSQTYLGTVIDKTQVFISLVESQKRTISGRDAVLIAEALDMPLTTLFEEVRR